ncbi:N-acetyltransferase family protein [Streptococcus cameli]
MEIRRANQSDIDGIISVCSAGWRDTYADLHTQDYIEEVIQEYYNPSRIAKEIEEETPDFHGYWVAEEDGNVLGCIGGGIDAQGGHIYVFYVEPTLKGQGIGTALLNGFTQYQKDKYVIDTQWITYVTEGNYIGLSFYQKQGFHLDKILPNRFNPDFPRSLQLRRTI